MGIPNRQLEWCLRPENAHDFCEDFDHANPTGAWAVAPDPTPGLTSRTFVPSTFDPPNVQAMDSTVGPLATSVSNFIGLQQSFTNQVFGRVDVGVDIRIVSTEYKLDGDIGTAAGFLLLSDIPSSSASGPPECIGFLLLPTTVPGQVTINVLLVPDSTDCLTVDNVDEDGGPAPMGDMSDAAAPTMAASPMPTALANVFTDQWFRLKLTVTRGSDGSGSIDFSVPSGSSMAPPSIPAGSLGTGFPGLSIGTDVTGPSGTFDIQFDNVTVDFSGN